MTTTIIAILIASLIALLVAANAIDQYRQKLAVQRHQLLLKLTAIVLENEELLLNNVQLPLSNTLKGILLKRSISVIEQILSIVPDSERMPDKLAEVKEQLTSIDLNNKDRPSLVIPKSDQHNAALIKTIKMLRYVITKQKNKGALSASVFQAEDKILELYMLRIFVEFKIAQANNALSDAKLGSARQFYEKALKTLRSQTSSAEYVAQKEQEVLDKLNEINESMREKGPVPNEESIVEGEDYDQLFSNTKKKWDME